MIDDNWNGADTSNNFKKNHIWNGFCAISKFKKEDNSDNIKIDDNINKDKLRSYMISYVLNG